MLQEFVNKNNLPVTIHGSTDDISGILEQHDIFISCSIIEGFGISVAEAMAAQIPMLISDITTFKEITENKGWFFESRNASDLANKIELFYNTPAITNQSVADCRNVAEKYRKYLYVEKLNELYQSKLKED